MNLTSLNVTNASNNARALRGLKTSVTNEEVQETARVYQGQGSKNHAPHSEAAMG